MPGFVELIRSQLDKAKAINNHLFGLQQFVIGKPIWEGLSQGAQEPDPKARDAEGSSRPSKAEIKKG